MLNIGDFAFDTTAGTNVQVLEKINVWGYVSYKVFNPATGKVYKVSEEQLNIESSGILYDENYLRYVTLLSKIKNETAGGLLSSLSSGIIPLPHQLHEALDGKGIMLGGDTEFLFPGAAPPESLQQHVILLEDLPGIVDEFDAVVGGRDALAAAGKQSHAQLLLQLPHGAGKGRLGNI